MLREFGQESVSVLSVGGFRFQSHTVGRNLGEVKMLPLVIGGETKNDPVPVFRKPLVTSQIVCKIKQISDFPNFPFFLSSSHFSNQ